MHRIDTDGNVNNQFADGDPTSGQEGTLVDAAWLTDTQETLCNAIEAAGLELSKGEYDQLTKAIAALTPGRLLNVQVFTASGTYEPTAGTNKVRVTVQGGGGSGGGAAAPANGNCSAGNGGSNGAAIKVLVAAGFAGATVTVGAGGAAPVGGANGNPGSASSFGTFATAPGGPGGTYNGASSPGGWISDNAQSAAPTFSGCTLIFAARGGPGGGSCSFNAAQSPRGGNGGGGLFGAGAPGSANGAGSAALNYGSGGGGASANFGSGPFNGGPGMGGIIIIEEFA